MHKKGNCIFCSYRFPINTWFICTRYICNFRFCLIHLIKELCIVMRIQVLYTADLKILRQGSSPDFDHRCFSLPGFPVVSEKQLPYTVTVSLRILTGFSFAHQVRCNLCVITLHIFNSDILFLSHFTKKCQYNFVYILIFACNFILNFKITPFLHHLSLNLFFPFTSSSSSISLNF